MGLRDQILGTNETKLTAVEVPEWNITVYLRSLTGGQAAAYHSKVQKQTGTNGLDVSGLIPWLLVRTICDESGTLQFKDSDISALDGKEFPVLERLFHEALKASGMGAKEKEEAEKN